MLKYINGSSFKGLIQKVNFNEFFFLSSISGSIEISSNQATFNFFHSMTSMPHSNLFHSIPQLLRHIIFFLQLTGHGTLPVWGSYSPIALLINDCPPNSNGASVDHS